jgi:hypothetical protein
VNGAWWRDERLTRFVWVLCEDEAAFVLDGFQPKAAVGACSREDDADGMLAEIVRH